MAVIYKSLIKHVEQNQKPNIEVRFACLFHSNPSVAILLQNWKCLFYGIFPFLWKRVAN